MAAKKLPKLGLIKDIPDNRDFTTLPYLKLDQDEAGAVDLRPDFSPIEDQGSIGSCTANAVAGVIEYLEKKAYAKYLDASRLFIYKTARLLDGIEGDGGSSVRTACKALRVLGVCPEKYMPYKTTTGWDAEPTAFQFALAQGYQAIDYYTPGLKKANWKTTLKNKIPIVFGFDVVWENVPSSGILTVPTGNYDIAGGHAVVAVGYNANYIIFRNSWGKSWGEVGYGYMPWEYLELGLIHASWVIARLDLIEAILI
jgi:C1A family cysteine protease